MRLKSLFAAAVGFAALALASAAAATGTVHIEWMRGGTVYAAETISATSSSVSSSAAPSFAGTQGQARITVVAGAVVMVEGAAPTATQTNGVRLVVGMAPVIVAASTGDHIAIIEATDGPPAGGGSGGGAVTVADGADATQGAQADAACATDNGTCSEIALLKRDNQRLTSAIAALGSPFQAGGSIGNTSFSITGSVAVTNAGTFAVQSTNQTQTDTVMIGGMNVKEWGASAVVNGGVAGSVGIGGQAANNASPAGNPVPHSCLAVSAEPTLATNGQNAECITDLAHKTIVLPYANPENMVSGTTAAMTSTTSTSLVAAPGAGLRNYITTLVCVNSHATVGTFVTVQDGSGGTALATLAAASVFGGTALSLPTPLRQPTANTALFVADVTTGANVICSAAGYKGS